MSKIEVCNSMSIITRNIYLKYAFDVLYKNALLKRNILVIDVDAHLTLCELLCCINELSHDDTRKIAFTGAAGFYEFFFKNLDWINIHLPRSQLVKRLMTVEGISINTLRALLMNYLTLQDLSSDQVRVALLSTCFEVKLISRVCNISEKTTYGLFYAIFKKMQFSSLNHLRYFMIREYNISFNFYYSHSSCRRLYE